MFWEKVSYSIQLLPILMKFLQILMIFIPESKNKFQVRILENWYKRYKQFLIVNARDLICDKM